MILLLLVGLVGAQAHAVAVAWWGPWAPDPCTWLLVWAGLGRPSKEAPWLALGLGLGRALVLAEPAGGAVLAALAAIALLGREREAALRAGAPGILLGALFAAAVYFVVAGLLRWLCDAPVQADVGLFVSAAVLVPVLACAPRRPALRA